MEGECNFRFQEHSDEFPLLIKKHDTEHSLSSFIHSYSKTDKFLLEGPQGQGLMLNMHSKGQYIAIVGGLGIVPFLDLLDFMLKKVIYQATKKMQSEQFAKNHIDRGFGLEEHLNDFQFLLYLAVPNKSEFIGQEIIENLYKLNKSFNLSYFDCVIRCKEPFECDIPIISEKFDRGFLST